jgi:hypothetical protein
MPALAPGLRPPEGSRVEVADPVPVALDDVELEEDSKLEVGLGTPVVGKVRGVDVSEDTGVPTAVVVAGTSEA